MQIEDRVGDDPSGTPLVSTTRQHHDRDVTRSCLLEYDLISLDDTLQKKENLVKCHIFPELTLSLSFSIFIFLSLSLYLSAYLFLNISPYLTVYLSVILSITPCPSLYVSLPLSLPLYTALSVFEHRTLFSPLPHLSDHILVFLCPFSCLPPPLR